MFKFNDRTPKKIKFNGLNVAKLVFNNNIIWLEKILKTVTGYPITLEKSTGKDLVNYKIYGNSGGVGDKTANLFDNNDLLLNTHYSYGGAIQQGFNGRIATPRINVEKIESLAIKYSRNEVACSTAFLAWDKDNNLLVRNASKLGSTQKSATIDLTQYENIYEVAFFWWNGDNTLLQNDIFDVMICESIEPIEYEPFGYKIPVSIHGKNLWNYKDALFSERNGLNIDADEKGVITITGKPTVSYTSLATACNITDLLDDNQIYVLSVPEANPKLYAQWVLINKETSAKTYKTTSRTITQTTTIDKNTYDYFLNFTAGSIETWGDEELTLKICAQVEKNSKVTEYELYIEPTTINIYLDEPLYENEYIDFKTQKIVKENSVEDVELQSIPTFKNLTTIIETKTDIKPSDMEVEYYEGGD